VANEKALSPGQKDAMEKNLLRGLLFTTKPITPGDITSFQSGQVPADMERLMSMLQSNITEIMGADEQMVAGKSSNDTLGQDELARMGTQIRESGMQDKVREWLIDQCRKEGTLVKQFSNAELHIQITGEDYSNHEMGVQTEEQWISFMTETNPLGAKHYLQGEFEYDINIYEAIKPNKQVLRQQYTELMTSSPVVEMPLLQDGCRLRTGLIAKEWIKAFDGIGNPARFIEKLDPMQVDAIRTQKLLESGAIGQQQPAKPAQPSTPAKPKPTSSTGVSQPSSNMAKEEA